MRQIAATKVAALSIFGPMLRRAAAGNSLRAAAANSGLYSNSARKRPQPPVMSSVPDNFDTVRAIACILLVAFHVVGSGPDNGLRLPLTSVWHYAVGSLTPFRMPVFAVLSGYLYACRRVDQSSLMPLWRKRLCRIGIPLITGTIALYLLRHLIRNEEIPLLYALTHSYQHFWFLQATILIFALVTLWDAFCAPSAGAVVIACVATAVIADTHVVTSLFFSIDGAVYLLPFFLFGMIVRECPSLLSDRLSGLIALALISLVLAYQHCASIGLMPLLSRGDIIATIGGLAAALTLLRVVPVIGPLHRLGAYSYTIYLWHAIAWSAVRTLLAHLAVFNTGFMFVCCCTAGVMLPLIFHSRAFSNPRLSLLLTGTTIRTCARTNKLVPTAIR